MSEIEHVSSTTVALDNVTLRTSEPVDSNALLVLGMVVNAHMEKNRDAYAKALSDLMMFGVCEWPPFQED